MSRLLHILLVSAAMALACSACGPEIGDDCETDLDCSAQGSRPCDRTQPGGYCTIPGCEARTCPEGAVCVKFRPEIERLAATFCMAECEGDDDCRRDEGYRCLRASPAQGGADGFFGTGAEAEVLDGDGRRFCAVPPMSLPDGGVADGGLLR